MAISAIVATTAAVGAYSANKQKGAMVDATNKQVAQAQAQQAQEAQVATRQREQTDRIAATQMAAEQERADALAKQQAQQAAAAAALSSQQATDSTLGMQNMQISNLTPTVQLAAQGDGDASAEKSRARRAQFRPEYVSGVTI